MASARLGLAVFATVRGLGRCLLYAAFYAGCDAVVGIAAGAAGEHADGTASHGSVERPLYATGEALGEAGASALICAIAATAVALLPK